MKTEKMLTRGKGYYINCTDYDDALEYAKKEACGFAEWYFQNKHKYNSPIESIYNVWINAGRPDVI